REHRTAPSSDRRPGDRRPHCRPDPVRRRGSMNQQSVVTLQIAGEEYTIRAHATPEHARACAAHVDAAMKEILQASTRTQPQRAAILAALAIADELFQARAALDNVQSGISERVARLTADIEARLVPENLAAPR